MDTKIFLNEHEEKIIRLIFLEEIMKIDKIKDENSSELKSLLSVYKEIYKGLDGKGTMILNSTHKVEIINLLNDKLLKFNKLIYGLDDTYEPNNIAFNPIILEAIYNEYNELREKIEVNLA